MNPRLTIDRIRRELFYDEWTTAWVLKDGHTRAEAGKLVAERIGGEVTGIRTIRANVTLGHDDIPNLTPADDGEHEFWEIEVDE